MSALDVDRVALWSLHQNKRASFPPTSLSSSHISEALRGSTDNGSTLDLAKKGLTDVGESGAEELATIGREEAEDESPVLRIALGNNRLATLPMAFALLSRLRYLNLRSNCFSVFPDVLTLMPSLDTLDISHNKLKRLPSQPGSLVNLRVFCFSRNKVTKLPAYLSKFHRLSVLKVDRNPIEWPPRSLMDAPGTLDAPQAMKDWIRSIQKWMEDDSRTRPIDDSGFSEQFELENDLENSYNSWSRFPIKENDFNTGVTPHARSFSADSNFSASSSVADSLQDIETSARSFNLGDRPPPLRLGILQSYSAETSPTRSFESYLPSPAESINFSDDHTVAPKGRLAGSRQLPQQHSRTASYASGVRTSIRSDILGKQSMPDLRTAKLNFTKRLPDLPDRTFPTAPANISDLSLPSPLPQRQDHNSLFSSGSKPSAREPTQQSPTRSVPSITFERNSYFRRLSNLPSTTISNTLPKPLVCLIDSARSVLFAVCQIYQALEHYIIHAIDDRLSSVLRKVVDPAAVDMMQLINCLDRFDAMSRKKIPPPALCRSVIESCKDTVAVFGKAVGVLGLQLKVIATGDDVRYLRSMLLTLYGATAEIACAWQAMVPHIDAIKPLLHAKHFPAPSPNGAPPGNGSHEHHSSSVSLSEQHLPPALRSYSSNTLSVGDIPVNVGGRIRMARRHAGSFSSKDVELGKQLPSYDDVPSMSGGVISGVAPHTPTLRTPKRQATVPQPVASVTISSPSPTSPWPLSSTATSSTYVGEGSHHNHSRQGSQTSFLASSLPPSPSVAMKTTFLEFPSNSKTQVDKEALHAVQKAVEVAPAVWDMMDEILGDVLDSKADVRESLDKARTVTKRLSDTIRAMQEGDPSADKVILREDAHVFLKIVVQLSNVIKTYGVNRSVPSTLRSNMVKLTNSTEEFAILLHVSSFTPSSTTRPHSPMLNTTTTQSGLLGPPDENRLGPSLSRSRSAQPSASIKLIVPPQQEGPRSALPTQSFNVPTIRRISGKETRVDGIEPG